MGSTPALADAPLGASTNALSDDPGWPAGSVQAQLDRDETLVPFGKGAIFVPAMTNPLDEPPISIYSGERKVTEATTGRRIVLSPGTYEVRLGSGAVQQRLRYQASVRERFTTIIPVSWAGLSIHVMDEQFGNLRASYEIIRVRDREYVGVGFGTDEQAGEPVTTWILEPGLYKIVRVGDNYSARRDFATVRLTERNHTHFMLVLDPETGDFRGGGEVPETELFRPQDGFFGSLVIGGDLQFNTRSNAPGAGQRGLTFQFQGFLDGQMSVEVFGHPLVTRLQIIEGFTRIDGQDFRKVSDRVDLDALYIYRWSNWVGPYVQFGADTNLFPNFRFFDDSELDDIRVEFLEGRPKRFNDLQRFQVAPSGGLLRLREGGGINFRLFRTLFAEVNVRTGIGGRHRLANNLFNEVEETVSDDLTSPPMDRRVFQEVQSDNDVGVEATVLAVGRITRWVILNLEVDTLAPFTGLSNTLLDLEGSVALKLTRFLSVRWVVRFIRDREIQQDDRLENDILLRFSVELL